MLRKDGLKFPRQRWTEWFGGIVTRYNNDTKLWKVQFDSDTDVITPLRYYSIIECVDENASNFNQYHLLISLVPPSSTTATIPILPILFEDD